MITRILLDNYMSHARTVIEPAAGLTVIVGPNNCGKSAIVSALQTLCGDNDGDFMVRHGEKGCQVTVETEDGHTVTWRRKGKTVSYVLDGVEVHRVGRGNLPDDLQTLLRLSKVRHPNGKDEFDVHFADQKSPIFLIDREADTAAFFSTASDAEKLLEMQKRHKDKVRDARREHTRYVEEAAEVEALLGALSPLDEINARLEAVEETQRALQEEDERIAALSLLIDQIGLQGRLVEFRSAAVGAVAVLRSPPELADVAALEALVGRLNMACGRVGRLGEESGALAMMRQPPTQAETAPLGQDVARLVRAIETLEVARARRDSLARLTEVPALADEGVLSVLCDGIARGSAAVRRIGAVRQSLATLGEPPAVVDTAAFEEFLGRLDEARGACVLAAERHAALAELREAGLIEDPAPLGDLIERINRAVAVAAEQGQAMAEHDRRLAGVDEDLNAWLWANPACPTCGGATTRENLLTGAHAHAPAATKGGSRE